VKRYVLAYPPSTNNLFITAGKHRVRSIGYRDWVNAAGFQIMEQGRVRFQGPVSLSIALVRPDKRKRDLSNAGLKAIEDLLVEMGVIEDDSLVQRIDLQWAPSGDPCTVLIQKHEGGVA
jgi:crossover junction endodeoxyribonuclease RusA